jgi:hypothetical protein
MEGQSSYTFFRSSIRHVVSIHSHADQSVFLDSVAEEMISMAITHSGLQNFKILGILIVVRPMWF